MIKSNSVIVSYLLCALFAALTAVCSQIMVPLPFTPVPISLALLAVFVCGGALGAKRGAIAMLVYILLGAIGVPVFHAFSGGLGVLAGPTGGYIVGYLPAAVVMGLMARRRMAMAKEREYHNVAGLGLAVLMGLPAVAACYAPGTAWFMAYTGMGFGESMMMCVIPFIPGDMLKLVCAAAVCEALRRPMRALGL